MVGLLYYELMLKQVLRVLPLLIVTFAAASLLTTNFFQHTLAYYFPNQWQPTSENINQTGEYDFTEEQGIFLGQTVQSSNDSSEPTTVATVLGDTTAFKHIEVDLSTQRVYAFEGAEKVMEFIVSTGKWGKTPTGHFNIEYKTRAQKMSGGSKALGTYYYLPNVQYVQFFGNDEIPWSRGFSFHEAYWHNNFGTPMSHGCINMKREDAEKLYYWTTPTMGEKKTIKATSDDPGTPVFIYGEAPPS
jgi:lipoprotein-anchoring transpeptidase ErfK/SrfK